MGLETASYRWKEDEPFDGFSQLPLGLQSIGLREVDSAFFRI